jgi:hypothetical protein
MGEVCGSAEFECHLNDLFQNRNLFLSNGLFAVDVSTATSLLHTSLVYYDDDLLHSMYLFPRVSDRYFRLYKLAEYFDEDIFHCTVSALSLHFLHVRCK